MSKKSKNKKKNADYIGGIIHSLPENLTQFIEPTKQILLTTSIDNKIFSRELVKKLGLFEYDNNIAIRQLIFTTAKLHNLPIISNLGGYWLATSKKEVKKYIKSLDKRIRGIEERKEIIIKNWKAYNNK